MAQMFNFDLTDEQLDQIPAKKFLKIIDAEREAMKSLEPPVEQKIKMPLPIV
jgi:hypothetical protein